MNKADGVKDAYSKNKNICQNFSIKFYREIYSGKLIGTPKGT